MKENYTSPQASLVGFAPSEQLAAVIDFDDLLNISGGSGSTTTPSETDIKIELK